MLASQRSVHSGRSFADTSHRWLILVGRLSIICFATCVRAGLHNDWMLKAEPAKGNTGNALIPLRGYRRTMVNAMAAATAVPHFHLCDDVQMDALIATRDTLQASISDLKISLLPLLIKSLSLALTQHPEVNAKLGDDLKCIELIGCVPD